MAYATNVIPALRQMLVYMNTVKAALPELDIGVYMGVSTESQGRVLNTLSLGAVMSGGLPILTGFNSKWRSLSGGTGVSIVQNTPFSIHWSIVTWAGNPGANADLSESPALINANTIFNAMVNQILADPGGSGNLGGSSWWDTINMDIAGYGPVENGGSQLIMECVVGVSGVTIGKASS